MATSTLQQAPNQLVVTLTDVSHIDKVRKAIASIQGVKTVRKPRMKRISPIERSMKEVQEGKLYEAKDLDDLFEQLNS